jgi:hypothetical protein
MLTLVPDGEQPRSLLVGPKLSYMDERIVAIDLVTTKLVRCPLSLSTLRVTGAVEKASSEDEFHRRRYGSPARRRP